MLKDLLQAKEVLKKKSRIMNMILKALNKLICKLLLKMS